MVTSAGSGAKTSSPRACGYAGMDINPALAHGHGTAISRTRRSRVLQRQRSSPPPMARARLRLSSATTRPPRRIPPLLASARPVRWPAPRPRPARGGRGHRDRMGDPRSARRVADRGASPEEPAQRLGRPRVARVAARSARTRAPPRMGVANARTGGGGSRVRGSRRGLGARSVVLATVARRGIRRAPRRGGTARLHRRSDRLARSRAAPRSRRFIECRTRRPISRAPAAVRALAAHAELARDARCDVRVTWRDPRMRPAALVPAVLGVLRCSCGRAGPRVRTPRRSSFDTWPRSSSRWRARRRSRSGSRSLRAPIHSARCDRRRSASASSGGRAPTWARCTTSCPGHQLLAFGLAPGPRHLFLLWDRRCDARDRSARHQLWRHVVPARGHGEADARSLARPRGDR